MGTVTVSTIIPGMTVSFTTASPIPNDYVMGRAPQRFRDLTVTVIQNGQPIPTGYIQQKWAIAAYTTWLEQHPEEINTLHLNIGKVVMTWFHFRENETNNG